MVSLTAEPALYAAEETLAYANMGELHLTCLSEPMGDAVIPLFADPPAPDNKQTDELVMWVKRLAHSLRKANPDSKLQSDAMDYLTRKGLISVEDVLR
ncbi:TPA: hypothetical protein ACNABU_004022 [Citrobacter amalonaticus]